MIRTPSKPSPTAFIVVALLAMLALAPVPAHAAPPGALPAAAPAPGPSDDPSDDDAPAKSSRLIVMCDFNRDGIPDMAEAALPAKNHSGPNYLTLSLGQSDGTFKPSPLRLVLGHSPKDMVTGDFNHDGIPDLIVGDDDGTLALFVGDGTGNLLPAGNIAHLASVVSIAVADFNHDGTPDIAVTDWRTSTVTIFLSAGKGIFRGASAFPLRMPGTTPHVTAADFNGDGIPDLAIVYDDDDGGTYDVMLGDGHGNLTYAPQLSLVKDPNSHCPS